MAATLTMPRDRRAVASTARIVVSATTSGVTLARATTSPDSTGCPSNSVKTDIAPCAFTSASASTSTASSPRRVAASAHWPPT